VEKGVDVNKTNNRGETPLSEAYRCGNETSIKYLIDNGAKTDEKQRNNEEQRHDKKTLLKKKIFII